MSKPLVSNELWNTIAPLLPPEPPKPKGGRPRVPDGALCPALVDAVAPIRQPRGRPRRRPAKFHADKASDSARCRAALRRRGIVPRIARKGVESSAHLGRFRWVAERTLAWLAQF